MNPFHHGVAVTGRDFCPRPTLVSELGSHIEARQNCVVKGIRRIGKTSAVLEAIRARKKTRHMYINCWGKQDIRSLATAIYEAFLIYQRRKGLSLEKIIRTFAHLRPKASIDPYSGDTTFSLDLDREALTRPQSLEAVFDFLASEGGKQSLVVVLDEFQALLEIPEADAVMATLRGTIQLQPEVTYFYLGSTRHLIDDIFNSPERPFYKSAATVTVEPIERGPYGAYLQTRFATGKRVISADAMEAVFDAACDITGDVQQLCAELWNCTDPGARIGPDVVPRGLQRIHHAEHESNSRIIDLLTPGQVRALIGLARVGGKRPNSKEFLAASGIAQPSSVTKALNRLVERGLVYRDSEGHKFFSPFFRTWLLATDIPT